MNSFQYVEDKTHLKPKGIRAAINLLSDGASIPFIARYRKDMTQGLSETELQSVKEHLTVFEQLNDRKEYILQVIEEKGQLTGDLRRKIESTLDKNVLEDLYQPYKSSRKTRASIAEEKGLAPLAELIWTGKVKRLQDSVRPFLDEKVNSQEEAIQGAKDILAEKISNRVDVRSSVRDQFYRYAQVEVKAKSGVENEGKDLAKYRDYIDYSERVDRIPSHRFLAIQRGANEKVLRFTIRPDDEKTIWFINNRINTNSGICGKLIFETVEDSYKRLIRPSIENQVIAEVKEKSDRAAVEIFSKNLEQLLMAPVLLEKAVLAMDPGFKNGCKCVVLDSKGNLRDQFIIYPMPPQNQKSVSLEKVNTVLKEFTIENIAVGNGTAGKEIIQWLKGEVSGQPAIHYVSESGASIYSASAVAVEEFPHLDISYRGAVSIGRRLQDPLSELVKIDPQSIGVGQYQHDVDQKMLKGKLDEVVVSCVNRVGVDLNFASKYLLRYVSGLSERLSENIVKAREKGGSFHDRSELLSVDGVGDKTYEQCAGFLRIYNGHNPLDASSIHPEQYNLVAKMSDVAGCSVRDLLQNEKRIGQLRGDKLLEKEIGKYAFDDILKELARPGRNIRGEVEPPALSDQIHSIDDLAEGMSLEGVVTNITKFGAFVDLGIKENGLIHISQMSSRFIKSPHEVVNLGQNVKVKVHGIDRERGRIQLSMNNL
ncbi:helix-hairpin-helix domain-containing protein [Membranihabitans maritimus]|uniref:helix-hairpin-helix domain-containing protein n=1 Tax=Membranihabitans maritimus TaxID=2904244 RepID=UPI001F2D1F0E|nr:Tex family protein [Membranihabitans maritimus]